MNTIPKLRTRRIAFVLALVTVAGVGGYLALQWTFRDPRPISTADITSGTWTVISIDDTEFGEPSLPTIRMSVDGTAIIETGCERIVANWDFDSDGDAIGFRNIPAAPEDCPDQVAEQDDLLRLALSGTRSWVAMSPEAIEFRGADVVELRRS